MTPESLHQVITTLGLFVALCAVGRVAILFLIDGYYDALARVREREADLTPNASTDSIGFHS